MAEREGAELVLAYCSRRLDPDECRWYERHLEACDSCRELVEAQKQVWQALDFWETLPVPEDFDRRLERRIEAEERRPLLARLAGSAGWLRPAIPVASAAVIALAVFLVRTPSAPDYGREPNLEAAEVEQTERALEDLEMIRQFTLPPRESGPRDPM
jgi:anti-sigma factor RsiW